MSRYQVDVTDVFQDLDSVAALGLLAILSHWQFIDSIRAERYSLKAATRDYIAFAGFSDLGFDFGIIANLSDAQAFEIMAFLAIRLAEENAQ